MKIVDYDICARVMTNDDVTSRATAAIELAEKVRSAIPKGWEPWGNLVVVQAGGETFLYQPIVKTKA